jgi:hypothetical protein
MWRSFEAVENNTFGSVGDTFLDAYNRHYIVGVFSSAFTVGGTFLSSAGLNDVFLLKGYP